MRFWKSCLLVGLLLGVSAVAPAMIKDPDGDVHEEGEAPAVFANLACGPAGTSWGVDDEETSTAAFSGNCLFNGPGLGGTVNDAVLAGIAGDAFDLAYHPFVDGVALTGTAAIGACDFNLGPVSLSGLDVSMEYLASSTDSVLRVRHIFTNPTGSPISATVEVPVNFGSDSNTTIEATSSGDLVLDTGDRWAVTSDSFPSDPVNTTVLYGPGSPVVTPSAVTTTVFNCATADGIGATYLITVPANSTRSLMYFAGLGDHQTTNSVAGAIAAAARFDSNAALGGDLLSGLSDTQLAETLNWDFAGTVPFASRNVVVLIALLLAGSLALLITLRR